MEDNVEFEVKLIRIGGSTMFAVPPQLLEFIEAKAGDTIHLCGDCKKHGRYGAFYNKKQQARFQRDAEKQTKLPK